MVFHPHQKIVMFPLKLRSMLNSVPVISRNSGSDSNIDLRKPSGRCPSSTPAMMPFR